MFPLLTGFERFICTYPMAPPHTGLQKTASNLCLPHVTAKGLVQSY